MSSSASAPVSFRNSRRRCRSSLLLVLLVLLLGPSVEPLAAADSPESLREALASQRALVAADPDNPELLNDLGNLLGLAGQLADAEEAYRRALAIQPDSVTSLYNLALVLQEQGNRKEARQTLEAVIELDPGHAWAHYQLGTLYEEDRNRDKALRHYETAFALDRSLTSPKVNPHIVENRLVTPALLQLYVSRSPSTQSPRIYQQPGEVADMLLPEVPRRTAEPTAESTSPQPPNESPSSTRGTGSTAPESSLRTLDESQLGSTAGQSSSSTGMARPAAPSTALPEMDAESTDSDAGTPSTAPVEDLPSRASTPARRSDTPFDSPSDSSSDSQTGGSSRSYIPGVESTGRLELELRPVDVSESRAAGR